MEQIKPILQIEHDPNDRNCSCPGCDLQKAYLKRYAEFKNKKTFRVFEIPSESIQTEELLNSFKSRGYDLTAVVSNGLAVMRAVPPMAPLTEDILNEISRREEENKKNNFFGFSGPIGGIQ